MLEQFGKWFREHDTQLTWFIIGWLVLASLEALSNENYTLALVDWICVAINYVLWKRNHV